MGNRNVGQTITEVFEKSIENWLAISTDDDDDDDDDDDTLSGGLCYLVNSEFSNSALHQLLFYAKWYHISVSEAFNPTDLIYKKKKTSYNQSQQKSSLNY